jgi:hypothetical protein
LRHIKIREKIKGSGSWWVFVNYEGKRTSRKIGPKWGAQEVAKRIRNGLFLPNYRKSKRTPMERLNHNMSCTIQAVLQGAKNRRHWETLVGYTVKALKRHLEKQFKKGMTWENYGKWHVDHIRPKSSFSFIGPEDEEFKKCWALSNLQPLWAGENCSKGAKIPLHFSAPPPHPQTTPNQYSQ